VALTRAEPRLLVWGLCFGRDCRALAPLWLNALFRIGRWRHDVVLLGDRRIESLSHPRLTPINVVPDVERRYGIPAKRWTRATCMNLKPQIQFHVDLAAYDYALFMDLDVLVNTDRLEPLLLSKAARGRICAQRDEAPISADREWTGARVLTQEEKRRWGHHAVCAGIVGFPTDTEGLAFIRDWHRVNHAQGFDGDDQANLIGLLLRTYGDRWEYLGDTAVAGRAGMPARYEETLLHFSGGWYDLARYAMMRDYYVRSLHLPHPGLRGLLFRLRLKRMLRAIRDNRRIFRTSPAGSRPRLKAQGPAPQ